MPAAIRAFVHAVEAEVGALRRFVCLLDAEQTLLVKGQIDELIELARQKNELSAEVTALDTRRNAALVADGLSTDQRGVEAWFAAHPEETSTREAWSTLLALASQAQATNRINGELIQTRMQYNAQALATLLGTQTPLTLYGPDGQGSVASGQRISDSA